MSMTHPRLYRLTSEGLDLFQRVMTRQVDESVLDPTNSAHAQPVEGTLALEIEQFASAKEMAQAICNSLSGKSPQALAGDIGLCIRGTGGRSDGADPNRHFT